MTRPLARLSKRILLRSKLILSANFWSCHCERSAAIYVFIFFNIRVSSNHTLLCMNIDKHLIIIKEEDKTADISYCEYEDGKWKVQFQRRGKVYFYSYLNVQWLKNPVLLNPNTTIIYHNNQPCPVFKKYLI